MIPALVLTAGLATRLRPLSLVRAKAALPVGGVPLVRLILERLARAGVADAVLNLHHLPHTITGLIGDGQDTGVRVRYSWEDPVLGSAGGPRRALPLLTDRNAGRSSFLVVNGDTLTDADVAALVRAHHESTALVTMAVVPNTQPEKYGGIAATDGQHFDGFVNRGSSERSFHFIGVQVADAEAFAGVPPDVPHEIRTLYPALAATRPGSIRVFPCTADFHDIGTPADYLDTSLRFTSGTAAAASGARTKVDATARVERSILWDDVTVEAGALLRECVVTDGVRVPEDTSWHGVALRVAAGALMENERRIGELAISPL